MRKNLRVLPYLPYINSYTNFLTYLRFYLTMCKPAINIDKNDRPQFRIHIWKLSETQKKIIQLGILSQLRGLFSPIIIVYIWVDRHVSREIKITNHRKIHICIFGVLPSVAPLATVEKPIISPRRLYKHNPTATIHPKRSPCVLFTSTVSIISTSLFFECTYLRKKARF